MINQHTKHQLSRIVTEWQRAELAIKCAELNGEAVVLPAIAELRYAGRRLVDFLAISLNDSADAQTQRSEALLVEAFHDIVRAKHDAIDTMVAQVKQKISEVIEKYGLEAIAEVRDDIAYINNIKRGIAESRANRASRNDVYSDILDEDVQKICEIGEKYSYFSPSRKIGDKPIRFGNVSIKARERILAVGAITSAIVGLLAAVLSI